MRLLYPELSPYHSFFLETGCMHRIYVEESGNPAGMPVIFLHGGPCSGTRPDQRRFFDPQGYRIILMDQRGCGRSEPFGELQENTTQDLLEDMERIRKRLRIEQWLLFGGSWGATLALLYAQRYPQPVAGMVLRGVFLARQIDMDWFLGNGANRIFPEEWRALLDSIPVSFANRVRQGLYQTIFGRDREAACLAAKQWRHWSSVTALGGDFRSDQAPMDEQGLLQVRMELHYAEHNYFIGENQILDHCPMLQDIPVIIIHGRRDLTCPPESGWSLRQALPQARFTMLPEAGHVAGGPDMVDALVSATDEMLTNF